MRGHAGLAVRHVLAHVDNEEPITNMPDLGALNDQLDALWTRYLHLLDQYTKAQASIRKHLSSGFFALAQANSKSAGLGRRYGQDYYDHRTSATTKVQIIADEHGSLPEVRIVKVAQEAVEDNLEIVQKTEAVIPEMSLARDEALGEVRTITDDPIRWFGILLPPALHQAQASFISAVLGDDALAQAGNAARGMRDVEVDIGKLRKTIRKAEKSQAHQAEAVMG